MTAIVGVARDGLTVIGADARWVEGIVHGSTLDPKAWRAADWALGMAGDWTALCDAREVEPLAGWDVRRFHRLLVEMVDGEWAAVVGRRGELYTVGPGNGHLAESPRKRTGVAYTAAGSGREVCLGALHALTDTDLTLEQMATEALAAAERHTIGVGRDGRGKWLLISA